MLSGQTLKKSAKSVFCSKTNEKMTQHDYFSDTWSGDKTKGSYVYSWWDRTATQMTSKYKPAAMGTRVFLKLSINYHVLDKYNQIIVTYVLVVPIWYILSCKLLLQIMRYKKVEN